MAFQDYQHLSELIAKYVSELEETLPDDKKKSALYLRTRDALKTMAEGSVKVEVYEKHLETPFVEYWQKMGFELQLEDYKKALLQRAPKSVNKEKLFELELKSCQVAVEEEVDNENETKLGEKLGYEIAINGDNPILSSLVYCVTKYDFGYLFTCYKLDVSEFLSDLFFELKNKDFQKIFNRLHWVCVGYLKAKKLEWLNSVKNGYNVPETNDLSESPEYELIKWKGTPAQLAFVMNLLKEKGYLELNGKGETAAKQVLSHFQIEGHKTTTASLGKCFQKLNNDELPINSEDAARFQKIPTRTELKR